MAGRSLRSAAVGFQGAGGSLHNPHCRSSSWLQNGCAVPSAPDQEWLNRGLLAPQVGLPSSVFLPALEKGARMTVTIGVDPHKTSHTAAALDEHGQLLDRQRIPATSDGYQALRAWAERWPERRWAVEGAYGVGRVLAQQ